MSLNKTNIEWVFNPDGSRPGFTWNPITGCLNHNNGLCKGGGFPCYAYKLAHGRLRERYLANHKVACEPIKSPWPAAINDPFYPRFWPERIPPHTYNKMDWKGVPIGIFVCDMGELFGDWVPHDWQSEVFDVILNNPWHRFYLLTKQPQNLAKWSPFPDNCWVGATFTDDRAMFNGGTYFFEIEAKVKYISFEPLLGGLTPLMLNVIASRSGYIDWLIIGAQTKPYKPPKIEWVEEIVRAADQAGIPVFLKDNLKPLVEQRSQFPNLTMQSRQCMPERRTK